jgi:hypothetical protein
MHFPVPPGRPRASFSFIQESGYLLTCHCMGTSGFPALSVWVFFLKVNFFLYLIFTYNTFILLRYTVPLHWLIKSQGGSMVAPNCTVLPSRAPVCVPHNFSGCKPHRGPIFWPVICEWTVLRPAPQPIAAQHLALLACMYSLPVFVLIQIA